MEKTTKKIVTRKLAALLIAVAVMFANNIDIKATEQQQQTVTITAVTEQQTTEQEKQIIMFGNGTINATLPNGTPITVTVVNGSLEAKFGTETYKFRNALEIVGSALVSEDGLLHIYTFDHKYYVVDPVSDLDIPVWRNQESWQYVVEHAANSKEVYVSAFIDTKYFYETISGGSKSRERLVTKEDFERIITPNKPTEVPTTEVPATEESTTEILTTEAPVTEALTTEVPKTEAPTTEVLSTEATSTETLTTEAPVTEAPTTEVPETEAPITEAPTMEALTTETTTTEALTTEAPNTEASTTEVPKTEVPATEVPMTETPTMQIPATETPSTEVPTTEVPTTEAPKEVKVVDSVVKVEIVQFVTTEKATTEQATTEKATTTEKVVSKAKKAKTTYKVEVTGKKINKIRLVRYKGSKRKVLCTVTFDRTKRQVKFHKAKYTGVKEVTFTKTSHQIILLKDNKKALIIPRAKWQSGKTYKEKVLAGKWQHIIRENGGFAIAISNDSKIKGVKKAQPKVINKKIN